MHIEPIDERAAEDPGSLRHVRPIISSRRSIGGQICNDLNRFYMGNFLDIAKGGWLDPKLVTAARADGMDTLPDTRLMSS